MTQSEPCLHVTKIDVVPLDDPFDAPNPKDVPDALAALLFGQPTQTDAGSVGPLHTYAVLDAAKVTGLVELLEASGLEHRCLFQGEAYDDLRDVAPWIVRLEEGNAFTRHLFTASDAPWHLWDIGPGIYVRSRSHLDALWHHFRKFTKLRDADGKWFYVRFWDSDTQQALVAAAHIGLPEVVRFFINPQPMIAVDLFLPAAGAAITVPPDRHAAAIKIAKTVSPQACLQALVAVIKKARIRQDISKIAQEIHQQAAHQGSQQDVERTLHWIFDAGFRHKVQLTKIAQIEIAFGFSFLAQPDVRALMAAGPPDYGMFVGLNAIAQKQGYTHG